MASSSEIPLSNYPPQTQAWTTRPNGAWTTGLLGCLEDYDSCCCTLICPCVVVGQNIEIISDGVTGCGAGGVLFYLLTEFTMLGCLYTCLYRTRLRHKYMLPDHPCPDLCLHFFCWSCSVCQETRELKNRGWDPSITYNANVALFQKMTRSQAPPPLEMYRR